MTSSARYLAPDSGVTLIEMLVVLSLFAILAGAVVANMPGPRDRDRPEMAFLALSARLDAATDRALANGQGFGLWQAGDDVVLLEKGSGGRWVIASDPRLNPVKLSKRHARISLGTDDDSVFSVSPALIPMRGAPLRMTVTGGPDVSFDGLHVKQVVAEVPDAAAQSR